jgi:DNA-directed RNA polymerase beta subunit
MKASDIPKPPTNSREFFDPDQLRQNVFDAAKEAFKDKLANLESNNYQLKVTDVNYPDPDKSFSLDAQKKAILERRDITVPLRGTFTLTDKRSGQVVDKKTTIIAHIPYVTQRNTTIYNGSEYAGVNQQRLKSGVYTRIRESGEAEAHVNVDSGSGMGARVIFYPEKEVFIYRVQNTQIPLYGILKDLGVSDNSMEAAWGKEIFNKNKATYSGLEIDKLHHKVFNREF